MSKRVLWLFCLVLLRFSSTVAMRAIDSNDQEYRQYRWRSLPRDKDHMVESFSLPKGEILHFDGKAEICKQEYQQLLMRNCPAKLAKIISLYEQLAESDGKKPDASLGEIRKLLPSKILLTGPTGCGKSSLAKLIALKSGRPAITIFPVIANDFQNSGLENLNRLFLPLIESREPQVLIFNDFTSYTNRLHILHDDEAGLAERFWTLLDACEQNKNILVILTTYEKNLPEDITSRFKRSHFVIPHPDSETKKLILKYYLDPHYNSTDDQLGLIKTSNLSVRRLQSLCMAARLTARIKKYSPRDLEAIAKNTKYLAARRKDKSESETSFFVTKADFDASLKDAEEADRLFRGSIFYRLSKALNLSLYTPWIASTVSAIIIGKLYQYFLPRNQA